MLLMSADIAGGSQQAVPLSFSSFLIILSEVVVAMELFVTSTLSNLNPGIC